MGTKNNPGEHDCYSKADPDEPMFVLLGRDRAAGATVRTWIDLRRSMGDRGRELDEAARCADAMDEWCRGLGKRPTTSALLSLRGGYGEGPAAIYDEEMRQIVVSIPQGIRVRLSAPPTCRLAFVPMMPPGNAYASLAIVEVQPAEQPLGEMELAHSCGQRTDRPKESPTDPVHRAMDALSELAIELLASRRFDELMCLSQIMSELHAMVPTEDDHRHDGTKSNGVTAASGGV